MLWNTNLILNIFYLFNVWFLNTIFKEPDILRYSPVSSVLTWCLQWWLLVERRFLTFFISELMYMCSRVKLSHLIFYFLLGLRQWTVSWWGEVAQGDSGHPNGFWETTESTIGHTWDPHLHCCTIRVPAATRSKNEFRWDNIYIVSSVRDWNTLAARRSAPADHSSQQQSDLIMHHHKSLWHLGYTYGVYVRVHACMCAVIFVRKYMQICYMCVCGYARACMGVEVHCLGILFLLALYRLNAYCVCKNV